ncbi:MAG TPA: hypothetical protein VLS90_13745 [Thermodesulfobacteriota bacterium]|nr:hypothetical protein [Thermodesulfobacteriota bacterium]
MYPSAKEFVNSTAAARANGYIGGYGNIDSLKEELDQLGLSEEGRKRLVAKVAKSRR